MTARHSVEANKRSWLKKSISTPTLRTRDFSCAISDIVQVFTVTHFFGPRPISKHPAAREKTWNIRARCPGQKTCSQGFLLRSRREYWEPGWLKTAAWKQVTIMYGEMAGIEESKAEREKKKRRIVKMENFSKRETLEAGVWDEESFKAVIFEMGNLSMRESIKWRNFNTRNL